MRTFLLYVLLPIVLILLLVLASGYFRPLNPFEERDSRRGGIPGQGISTER